MTNGRRCHDVNIAYEVNPGDDVNGRRYRVRLRGAVRTPVIGHDLADGDGFSKPRDLRVEHDYIVWRQPADRCHHGAGRGIFRCSIHGSAKARREAQDLSLPSVYCPLACLGYDCFKLLVSPPV
jgi:hypothetical protein